MSTRIDIPAESSAVAKGKAPLIGTSSSSFHHEKVGGGGGGGYKKGVAIFDFVIRIGALITAITAAAVMGNTDQTLPFFTQFFQFEASYDDLPTFQYFVVSMAIVGGYVALSLPISIVSIIRPHAVGPRLLLLILDTIALAMTTAAASAAAAIDYLAHNGNTSANWLAICNQFGDFCQEASGAVVAAFVAVVFFVVLIVVSAVALRKH